MDTLLLDSDNLACGICDFQIAQTTVDCFVTKPALKNPAGGGGGGEKRRDSDGSAPQVRGGDASLLGPASVRLNAKCSFDVGG